MDRSWYSPELFSLEDHGYGRGTGHLVMPNGTHIAVHQDDDDLANALIREVWSLYLNEKVGHAQV